MTVEAYGQRAAEYIDLFGTIDSVAARDRELVGAWAHKHATGQIMDVGCGPGQWTNWLHEQGLFVAGVDPTPEFVAHAQRQYPDVEFKLGRAEALDVADASLSGILAWYSLIHTPPQEIPGILAEFARCVEPGGGLFLGFFEGPELAPFDHKVVTAYFWPIDVLSRTVEEAGFSVTAREARTDPGTRRQGTIVAIRDA
ncbi:class I SAM-dependent methyltransferase [Kibdelosporangium philippinense]|uniref:Class I SAM-dependent methyltransferase n=1 Tax=Kibdelosporangium philippinense TaxID=211113 RepID=A0ABS8ZK23_9PSEU|nr:class I SAM-dependent methyltransferase [Kibdelosporangium philippinense]MCE7008144.1 class I SAM-dependent methyltransferase [Kibdelosporangium philippinense]